MAMDIATVLVSLILGRSGNPGFFFISTDSGAKF